MVICVCSFPELSTVSVTDPEEYALLGSNTPACSVLSLFMYG